MAAAGAAKKAEAEEGGAQAQTQVPEKKRAMEAMNLTRMRQAEFVRTDYVLIAHATNTPEDIVRPEYYAHVSDKMKARDRLTVWADNMTWMAELVVLEVGRGWARVHPLSLTEFGTSASIKGLTIERDGYRVTHRGEFSQWSVIRMADSEVVSEGHGSQGGAVDWLDNHLKAIKR